MAIFDKISGVDLTSPFKYQAEQPLDARLVVDTFSELAELVAAHGAYEGMLVYVKTETVVSDVTYPEGYYTYNGATWAEYLGELKELIDGINTNLGNLGSGDMLKSVYDTNNNNKVDIAENAEKLGGALASEYTKKSDVDSTLSTTSTNPVQNKVITTALGSKVDTVPGKGLSTNDYTTSEKNKLAGIAAGAEVNVQSNWDETDTSSDAFIQNKPSIIDNLTSDSKTDVLSAAMGKALKSAIDAITTDLEDMGAGDMLKAVYVTGNANNTNKVDKAINAEQLGGVAASSYAKKSDIPNITVSQEEPKQGSVGDIWFKY
jgi:hypothetical protein